VATPGVDFFRVDRSGATKRLLVLSSLLVAAGGTAVGAHLVSRLAAVGHVVSLVGSVTMLGGLVLGFGTMATMIFEDVWLAIREEGLLVHDNGRETVIAWDDLASIGASPGGYVLLERAGADAVRWYAGASARHVAARIEAARRKAAIGVLRIDA
jgi:hypothetical protein